jgi:hypothetical protein
MRQTLLAISIGLCALMAARATAHAQPVTRGALFPPAATTLARPTARNPSVDPWVVFALTLDGASLAAGGVGMGMFATCGTGTPCATVGMVLALQSLPAFAVTGTVGLKMLELAVQESMRRSRPRATIAARALALRATTRPRRRVRLLGLDAQPLATGGLVSASFAY